MVNELAEFPVTLSCRLLALERSSFYRWQQGMSAVDPAATASAEAVREVFWEHSRRYGARRIAAALQARGWVIGRQQVRQRMDELGLRAIQPHSFVPRTTDSRHTLGYSPNLLLEMKLPPDAPGCVVVGDITYLPLQGGKWAYLATWMDLFSRRVVGWAVRGDLTAALVQEALEMALRRGWLPAGCLIHSDRGGQYAAVGFRHLLCRHGLRQSMSRRGESYDNAFAESLFSRYKAELLEGGSFTDEEEARLESFQYLEGYYNRVRRHSGLGYVSPEEYERHYWAVKLKAGGAGNPATVQLSVKV